MEMKRVLYIVSLLMCMLVQDIQAQMEVTLFRLLEKDMTANTHATMMKDRNGEVSALIKVVTKEQGFIFDGGMVGIVKTKQEAGEIWVYVPHGIKRLSIRHPQFGVLRDYYFPIAVENARTYEMILKTSSTSTDNRKGWLNLTYSPTNATVFIDEVESPTMGNGNLPIVLNYGQHSYQISAEGYETHEDIIFIDSTKVNLQVNLLEMPLLTLVAPNGDDAIYLNGSFQGTGRWTGRVSSGDYEAEVRREGFQPQPQSFVLVAGENQTVELESPIPLKANLTVRSPLEGAQIFLNGTLMGTTEWTGELDAATYTVELRMEGYSTVRETITLAAGQELTAELEAPISLKANLTVRSPLEGAQIYLNGTLMGVTEWTGELDAATYTVELRMEDYSTVSETVTLAQREERTLTMDAPTPLFGSLVVNSDPTDCNIYLDDELIENTAEAFRRIAVGNHRLLLTREGYESVELEVIIEGGRQMTLTPRLEPIVVPQDTIVPQDTVTTAMVETLLPDSSIFTPDSQAQPLPPDVISPKKRANAYWRSMLVPGWGDKYVRENGRFGVMKTIGAYGLIGAGVGMHFLAEKQYAKYQEMAYNIYTLPQSSPRFMQIIEEGRLDLVKNYNLANRYRRSAPILIGAGAAVWLYDVIWVAVKGRKSQSTVLTLDYDPQVNSGYLGYSITF